MEDETSAADRDGKRNTRFVSRPLLLLLAACAGLMALIPGATSGQPLSEPLTVSVMQGTAADAKPALEFRSICCGPVGEIVASAPVETLRIRYGSEPIWVRVSFPTRPGLLVLNNIVDVAELYVYDPLKGTVRVSRAGDTLPVSVRELAAPRIAFPIADPEIGKDIYLRIVQGTSIPLRFDYYDPLEFERETARANLLRATLLGAVLVMALYNIVVSYIARDLAFLFNAGTILGLLLLDLYLTGVGAAYLWGQHAWASNFLLLVALASAIGFGGLFVYFFLSGGEADSQTGPRSLLLAPPCALLALLVGIVFPYWVAQLMLLMVGAITLVLALGETLLRSWRGDVRARILLVPLAAAIAPGLMLIAASRILGIEFADVREHLLEIVLLLEALLFSLALAYRIRVAREQALRAHGAYVALEHESNVRLLRTVDDERSRIAGELHDTAGQALLAISNRLSRLARQGELTAALRAEIAESEEFSRAIVDDIRRISHDLHPATLDHLGLKQAICQLVRQLEAHTPIRAELSYELNDHAVSPESSVHLFRIIQELITNIAKHSDARSCGIRVSAMNGTVNLDVGDDGKGLATASKGLASGGNHIGLDVVRKRVQALSGTMTMSDAASGLRISISFPATPGRPGVDE